jgi:hypothetical protein
VEAIASLVGRAKIADTPVGRRCLRRDRVSTKEAALNIHLGLTPLISLLAGILILVMPRLLSYIVAIYLIAIGVIGLLGAGAMHLG